MDQDPSVPGLGPFAGSGMGLSGDPIHRPAFMGPLDLSPNIRIDRDQRSGPYFIDPLDPFGLDRIIENQEAKVRRQSHLSVGKEEFSKPDSQLVRQLQESEENPSMVEAEGCFTRVLKAGLMESSTVVLIEKERHQVEPEQGDLRLPGTRYPLCPAAFQVLGDEIEEGGLGGTMSLDKPNSNFHKGTVCDRRAQGSPRSEGVSSLPPLQGRLWDDDVEDHEAAQVPSDGPAGGQHTCLASVSLEGGQVATQGVLAAEAFSPSVGKRVDLEISWCPIVESNVSISPVHRDLIPQLNEVRGVESSSNAGIRDLTGTPSRPNVTMLRKVRGEYGKFAAAIGNFGRWEAVSERQAVAKAPDGNGGVYSALKYSRLLEDMAMRGVRYLDCYGVDNALVRVADPTFVGYFIDKGVAAAAKVVRKAYPQEKVGVFVQRGKGGPLSVVEYSELDSSLACAINQETGRLRYCWSNIKPLVLIVIPLSIQVCLHMFTLDFLNQVANGLEKDSIFHLAEKKILSIHGYTLGLKLEQFIFDAFTYAPSTSLFEVLREEEFAPVKNANGSSYDTPDSARLLVLRLHARWVVAAGGFLTHSVPLYLTGNFHSGFSGPFILSPGVELPPLCSYAGENLELICRGRTFHAPCEIPY
ncbi:hypothetical protein HHK36_023182 [Tetracentron sinense]|uniref:UDP-N-acetylglucosamine diphosphorylase n=1 Tax=Tetracentron sinense TaxID=13715 RepID=A0A835D563_TETSI|nr:hypothetical protein HHK36_023182 [Tetracentron sinense]